MQATLLTDNRDSWFVPYGYKLKRELEQNGFLVSYVFRAQEIVPGDICFLLSCSRLVDARALSLNAHNIVVHASDLPAGKGFAPLQWQILEGRDEIPLTLFEAVPEMDAGPYYLKSTIHFEGHELYPELRDRLGLKIIEMCVCYAQQSQQLKGIPQQGPSTSYPRRTAKHDELDVHKTIAQQFNHLRIADNERFPLYFRHRGHTYTLTVRKREPEPAPPTRAEDNAVPR